MAKKSTNKPVKSKGTKGVKGTGKRGRPGRPRKEHKDRKEAPEVSDVSSVRFLKSLGYCKTGCGNCVTNVDFVEGKKTIVRCIRCRETQRVSELLENPESSKKKVYTRYGNKDIPNAKKDEFVDSGLKVEEHEEVYVPDEFAHIVLDDEMFD